MKAMINGILRLKQIWPVVGDFFSDSMAIGSHNDISKEKCEWIEVAERNIRARTRITKTNMASVQQLFYLLNASAL